MKKEFILKIGQWFILASLVLFFAQCEKEGVASVSPDDTILMTNRNGGDEDTDPCLCLKTTFDYEDLSKAEIEAILFMREEEKLARDVYLKLDEKWESRIFDNISNAEERHMQALLCLIQKYGLEDPVGANEVGTFKNQNLKDLYEKLIEQGEKSLTEALLVGATIEDLDIADLIENLELVDNEDVQAVFGNLLKGSKNHLRAFVRNLKNAGEGLEYTNQYLDDELFAEILSGPNERGGMGCMAEIMCKNQEGRNGNCDGSGNKGHGQNRNGTGENGNCNGNGVGNGSGGNGQDCNGSGPQNGNQGNNGNNGSQGSGNGNLGNNGNSNNNGNGGNNNGNQGGNGNGGNGG